MKRLWQVWATFACVALAVSVHGVHLWWVALPRVDHRQLRDTLPSVEALRMLSLGYDALVADYYWFRAIYHFGDEAMHKHNYPNALALTQRMLALDPYFAQGYYFAGTALTLQGMDPSASLRLLEEGMRRRPDVWTIPFLHGFNSYYFAHDYKTAAESLAKAAVFAEAPPYTGALATRVAAHAGMPEIGLRLITALEAQTRNPKLQQLYQHRRQLLQLEQELDWLQQAVAKYRNQYKAAPKDLNALVAAGVLSKVPTDPLGGAYSLADDGVTVQTTSESKRLRLHRTALPPDAPPQGSLSPTSKD